MNKSQFYLSQCVEAASKSPMYYTLGSAIVKGGKVISTGYNHQRPNYDAPGGDKRLPLSMHAEMASIFNATRGRAPALKQQDLEEEQKQQKQKQKQQAKHYYGNNNSNDEQHGLGPSRVPYAASAHQPHHHHHHHTDRYPYVYETEADSGRSDGGRGWQKRTAAQSRRRLAKLNGADLYVCRVTRSGALACSKPCWRW
ncbi:hypothetical protein C8F01DRAFT_1259521 [Mycena amicta]|nr:hypothetical protein C8F01DRAFT_1259521 [Mycena amicta]